MSRSKHTEAQMIAALKQVEAGRTVDDVAREQVIARTQDLGKTVVHLHPPASFV
jgi:hypothetical protein